VLTNVLANAEKFTPEDARIDFKVEQAGDGRCRVTVSDNGRGPEAPRSEIQMFKSTSDPRTAGLGIGLTLARQILQAHGCDIALERGLRGGARVRFELPLARVRP
jgi:signal transduction histidine kinase